MFEIVYSLINDFIDFLPMFLVIFLFFGLIGKWLK